MQASSYEYQLLSQDYSYVTSLTMPNSNIALRALSDFTLPFYTYDVV
jgi:hypothetical protein